MQLNNVYIYDVDAFEYSLTHIDQELMDEMVGLIKGNRVLGQTTCLNSQRMASELIQLVEFKNKTYILNHPERVIAMLKAGRDYITEYEHKVVSLDLANLDLNKFSNFTVTQYIQDFEQENWQDFSKSEETELDF